MRTCLALLLVVLVARAGSARTFVCTDGARCDADRTADGVCTLDLCLKPRAARCGCTAADCCTVPRFCPGDAGALAHIVLALTGNHAKPVTQSVQVGARVVRVRCRRRPPAPPAGGSGTGGGGTMYGY